MKNMYEVKPDDSMGSGYPEGVVDIKYCSYPQAQPSPRWHQKENSKTPGNKTKPSKSESPWTLKPKDMPRSREGDKKFYALRPYGDLPDQTFTSPTRGDLKVTPGRGGYYDNPNFVLSPKMHQHRHEEERSSNTSRSRTESRKSRSKRHCVGATVIFLLVLLVITAIGISVYFLNEQMIDNGTMPSRPPPSKLDSDSLTADPDFEGTVRVTNYDWDSRMADKESDIFRQTASNMEKQLDNILLKSPIGPVYNYSVVHSISEGSVVLNFTVHLKDTSSDASEEEKKQLEEQKLNLKETPDIVVQAIKEGIEEIKKEQEQAGVTSSLPILDVDADAIEVIAVTTTTISPITSTTVSTTTVTTTASTTTPSPTTESTATSSTSTATTVPTPTTQSTTTKEPAATSTSSTSSTTPSTATTVSTSTTQSTATKEPAATSTSSTSATTPSTATTVSTPTTQSTATKEPAATSTSPTAESTATSSTSATTPSTATTVPTSTTQSTATKEPATTSTTKSTGTPTSSTSQTTESTATSLTSTVTPTSAKESTATQSASTTTSTPTTTQTITLDKTTSPNASTSTTTPTSTTDSFETTTPAQSTNTTEATGTLITNQTTSTETVDLTSVTSQTVTNSTSASTTISPITSSCPDLESWKEMIIMVCNSSIQAANEALPSEDQCYHYSQVVKCSTWLAHSMKYNCSVQDMRLKYNASMDWLSVTTYDCLGTDMDIIEPFPASNSCDDLNAFKYIIYYECNGNDVDNEPCSTMFDAPECVTSNMNDLKLNCSQEKVYDLLNQHRDSVFNKTTVKACEEKMGPLINGTCYGMSTSAYITVPQCFIPLRELKDETKSLNTTCRMFLEGTRCLEKKANDSESCSASRISSVLMSQMKYVKSRGEGGMPFLSYLYGSAEKIRRVEQCQENMESLEKVANICDDEEYISNTIFSNLCVYQTKQGQNQCSMTQSDLLKCTMITVQQLDPTCTDTKIEQAVMGKINETNSNSTICDNTEYCSSALMKNDDILVCLRFLSFINYTDLTIADTCQFYGEGLECMSYFLRYLEVFCQPETLAVPTANILLHNNHSQFDFNLCKDNLTLEEVPSTRPLCDNDEALLKYTTNTCIQPALNDVSIIPDPPCSFLTYIAYCVTKTLYESVIYCTPMDVANVVVDNADFVQAKYPSLNFTSCSVPDFNVSVETTTPSSNTTCKWDDITETSLKSCSGELMELNRTHADGKCEKRYQLFGCIESSFKSHGIPCPITSIDEMFKDHGDEVMMFIGINPRSCSDAEPVNKTCSKVNQLVVDPNAPEYILKCFSLVFVSLSDAISYDDACRLLAMTMTCAMKKSNMLGYDCTTETIGPAVMSYTSLVFKSYNFDPENCTAPIETRSMCEAGDIMGLIASSAPCTYYGNLNDQPTCQSLSMLVDCVSMRISASGMFCPKAIIHEQLVDNIDMFELNSTFNFSSCVFKDDVIAIPPARDLRSCSVISAADVSPLDICQGSIKEFQKEVNDSVKCRILFDVMGCIASSTFYLGYNCTVNDIARLYGSSVLQGFNPESCGIPSEDDVRRSGSLCSDGQAFQYFIQYDCKAYIPDDRSIDFCGPLRRLSNCLGGILQVCSKYEIEKMIQKQPFMMYIGSIDDCEGEITTTPYPNYMSTTPYNDINTTICVWESILNTANTVCSDQMMELAHNDSQKCPSLTALAQCIHIAMVARDINCDMDTFLQLTYQNAGYMRETFNIEVQDCLDANQQLSPPLYVVDRESLCRSSVVYDYVSKVACKDSLTDCNMIQYMECLTNNVRSLTNSECSMNNFTPQLTVDTYLQTYFVTCSNDTTGILNNACVNPVSAAADMTAITPCLTPIILLQDMLSCSLYAQALKCMATKLGGNCTIQLMHQYMKAASNLFGQIGENTTQMSVIPRVTENCNDFVSNLTVDTIPDICQDSDQIVNLVKRLPCIPQSPSDVSVPCLYMVPAIQMCIQLVSNMTGCNPDDIIQVVRNNTEHVSDLLPYSVLKKCLGGNSTLNDYCPVILPSSKHHNNIRSCLTLSYSARGPINLVPDEDICRLDSVAVKCVQERGRILGYDCDTDSIVPLIDSITGYYNRSPTPCTIDEIEGSICDQSDVMVLLATSYQCSSTYYNLQAESNCSILDKMTYCISLQLKMSEMYCDNTRIRESLISQNGRLQTYFNKSGLTNINFSSCVFDTNNLSYGPVNLTECSEMLMSDFDPVYSCQHALMALNQTQETEQQCQVFKDSMKCLVYSSQFSGYNCTSDDIIEMYIKNNTMLSTVYDVVSQSCSGLLEVPRLTSSSLCNIQFTYDYIIKYLCSQFVPGNSDRYLCSVILDLNTCIKSAVSTEFQTTCPSYLIEGHLQRQTFMTYIGSVSSCRNQSSSNIQSGCDGVSVNSGYFTDCDQQYTMINQEPENSCLHWEKTIQCVQGNVYNDGKFRYCTTKDVLTSLLVGIDLGKILPNFDPEQCFKENLPDDQCDEMTLYKLAMNKCDPRNNICGQEADIKECVENELNSHGGGCRDTIDEKLRDLIPSNNQECSEGQYSIDSQYRVNIFQNQTTSLICGLDWDDTEAEIICKQLGYSFGVAKSVYEYQELGGFTYNCYGNESRLEDCPQSPNRDCYLENEVAKAYCYNDDTKYGLIDGQSDNAGRVTVERNGVKGYLCAGYYGTDEVNAVCRKLGYVGGDELDDDQILTKSLDKIWQNTLTCPTRDIDFAGCFRKPWDVQPLPDNEFNYCYKRMVVYCHNKTRLNTGYRNNTGMLMMYLDRVDQIRLTPVCKENINQDLVTAQCRYLGFNNGGELLDVNPFASSFEYYFLRITSCPLTANSIEDCSMEQGGTCTQGPAILHCFINQTMYSDGDIKVDSAGRIWVYKYDLWGTICSKRWNDVAAKTFCRSQGYDSGVSRELSVLYNSDTKWLYNVSCFGNETDLLKCSYSTSDDAKECIYTGDAGAFCYNQSDNPIFTIRDGSQPEYGRVYFSVDGEEGALCAPRDNYLPQLICKQQGFDYGEYYEGGLPNRRTSISWRGDLRCEYGDTNLLMCFEHGVNWIRVNSSSPSEISCDGDHDVQVYCYREAWLNTGFMNTTGMITILDEDEQPIVLCENQINDEGLDVFCKSIGKSDTAQKITNMQFPGYHDRGNKGYNCSGGESHLSQCQINNVVCSSQQVVVRCDNVYDSGSIEELTMDKDSGRLKLLKYGVYGSMCADQWTDVEAEVFCKSYGYIEGYAKTLQPSGRVAQFHAFKCNGSEKSLMDCNYLNSPTDTCEDAAVNCITDADNFTISLEHQNDYQSYGRVLVTKSGVTSYLCDSDYLSSNDAASLCRHLGFAESEVLDVDNKGPYASAWEVDFRCNSYNTSLYGCINGDWKYQSWDQSVYDPAKCRFDLPQIRCSKPINDPSLPDLKTRCENDTIYDMVDKDCDDVIDRIAVEVINASLTSACQYFPELVRCLSQNLISKDIYCTEQQVYSALRQNKPEIMAITGGLNTDNCDGMTFSPTADCLSLPLFSQLLPKCFEIPNSMITDFTQIAQLCSQGRELFDCMAKKTREVGYLCEADDFMNLMAQNQQFMTQQLRFNVSFCIPDQPQQTTEQTETTTVSSDVMTRCLNSSIYDMVDKDCDDVIDNITVEVQTTQISACQYFPELVRCLSEKLINRNIYCSEAQVFTTLRQNQPEITSIIGGLNTDNCDGMTFVPNNACTSLPLYTQLLPQCYDAPDTMVTDPTQIAQLCSKGFEMGQCLLKNIENLGYTGCSTVIILNSFMQNPQWALKELKFDIVQCQQP